MKLSSVLSMMLLPACWLLPAVSFGQTDNAGGTTQMPKKIVLDGKELGPVLEVQQLARRGDLDGALREANKLLERDPENRYARLERAEIRGRMGQEESAAKDLEYLIEKHPDFDPAYATRARLFLKVEISQEGQHPLLDWLRSADKRKQRAALDVVLERIRGKKEAEGKQP